MQDELRPADASTTPTDAQLLDVLLAGLGLAEEPDSLWWEQDEPVEPIGDLDDNSDDEPGRQVLSAGATRDPLGDYLKQIAKVPLLSADEEIELAKRIEAGLLADEILAEAKRLPLNQALDLEVLSERGRHAKDHMIRANLRLVVSIAKRYRRHGVEILDRIQEGNLGLVRAVEKFDYAMGYRFSTYATWWIKQAISRGVADQARTIRVPVHMVEIINKVARVERQISERLGHRPTEFEVARILGMSTEKVAQAKSYDRRIFSLSERITADSDYREYWQNGDNPTVELQYLLVDDYEIDPWNAVAKGLDTELIRHVLNTLDPREVRILEMRFGLVDGKQSTLEEIGKVFGVTRERIRQLEKKAKTDLSHPSRWKSLASIVGPFDETLQNEPDSPPPTSREKESRSAGKHIGPRKNERSSSGFDSPPSSTEVVSAKVPHVMRHSRARTPAVGPLAKMSLGTLAQSGEDSIEPSRKSVAPQIRTEFPLPDDQCVATTSKGSRCRFPADGSDGLCLLHRTSQ